MNEPDHPGASESKMAEEPADLGAVWTPETDANREVVRKQLEQILHSPHFKTGSRGPALFRYIVENALAGRTDLLKERTLGVEVFGREPTYDTNLDPVVRVTASRIRHRIAHYYADSGHETEIRVSVPSGSYVPVFRMPHGNGTSGGTLVAPAGGARERESANAVAGSIIEFPSGLAERSTLRIVVTRGKTFVKRPAVYVSVASLVVMAFLLVVLSGSRTDLELFWGPVLDSPDPVLVCLGTGLDSSQRDSAKPDSALTIVEQRRSDIISWPDALTMSRLTDLLTRQRKAFQVQRDNNTSLSLLRSGPAVFIGAFNNLWVVRLTQQVRFRFEHDPSTMWIADSQDASRRDWKVVMTSPFREFKEDYGIVTRILDPTTERMLVVAGGLGSYGTVAAGELVTTPKYLQMLARRAPSGWQKKNLQVVFKTAVIAGSSGPPEIVATHSW